MCITFPQALPGDIVMSLVLTAPADGTYRAPETPNPGGSTFGVGADLPFWADIVGLLVLKCRIRGLFDVSPVDRDPVTGCPANVFYTIYATISVNGPVTVTYNWRKSDGTLEDKKTIKFTEASSRTVSMEWSLHLGAATNERWVQIFTLTPDQQDYGKATFTYSCS
jgi:hypothetical protein